MIEDVLAHPYSWKKGDQTELHKRLKIAGREELLARLRGCQGRCRSPACSYCSANFIEREIRNAKLFFEGVSDSELFLLTIRLGAVFDFGKELKQLISRGKRRLQNAVAYQRRKDPLWGIFCTIGLIEIDIYDPGRRELGDTISQLLHGYLGNERSDTPVASPCLHAVCRIPKSLLPLVSRLLKKAYPKKGEYNLKRFNTFFARDESIKQIFLYAAKKEHTSSWKNISAGWDTSWMVALYDFLNRESAGHRLLRYQIKPAKNAVEPKAPTTIEELKERSERRRASIKPGKRVALLATKTVPGPSLDASNAFPLTISSLLSG